MIPRGTLLTAILPGEYGKPRPAVVVQAEKFGNPNSTVICPLTSFHADASLLRPAVEPTSANGLELRSFVMVDKLVSLPNGKLGDRIGILDAETLEHIDIALRLLLGLD